MFKFLGNDLYKIQIQIGIHSKIYTFLEGFRMHVTKAFNTFAYLQQNCINIHYNTPVLDFLEDKKIDTSET